MDPVVVGFLVTLAVLSGIPAWLTGSILKKHAEQQGDPASDWIPFSVLPFAFTRFEHKNRFAIVWAYVFSNLVFLGAVIAFAAIKLSARG